mmetsp:Transcript_28667/g.70671  ORF Transcript_28667/g.70671 Transcript_28667/m.70671 type:complete len:232 (+) Transcript_28667:176-871(+)
MQGCNSGSGSGGGGSKLTADARGPTGSLRRRRCRHHHQRCDAVGSPDGYQEAPRQRPHHPRGCHGGGTTGSSQPRNGALPLPVLRVRRHAVALRGRNQRRWYRHVLVQRAVPDAARVPGATGVLDARRGGLLLPQPSPHAHSAMAVQAVPQAAPRHPRALRLRHHRVLRGGAPGGKHVSHLCRRVRVRHAHVRVHAAQCGGQPQRHQRPLRVHRPGAALTSSARRAPPAAQ